MKPVQTYPYDPAEFLTDNETIGGYQTLARESQDPKVIAKALGAVARARGGITELARQTGLTRESLYRSAKTAIPNSAQFSK